MSGIICPSHIGTKIKASLCCCSSVDLFMSYYARQHLALALYKTWRAGLLLVKPSTNILDSWSELDLLQQPHCEPSSLPMPSRLAAANLFPAASHNWLWTVNATSATKCFMTSSEQLILRLTWLPERWQSSSQRVWRLQQARPLPDALRLDRHLAAEHHQGQGRFARWLAKGLV